MTAPRISHAEFIEPLQEFVQGVVVSFEEIPVARRELLQGMIDYLSGALSERGEVKLNFICTHNSRRSHLAQVWAQVAAHYFDLQGVKTYSGGTEATECNIRTVRSFRRAGFAIVASTEGENPVYLIQFSEEVPAMSAFSKVYSEGGNPQEGYAAMMCCSDVSEKCPLVFGAEERIPLHYEDPKAADGTAEEAARYDERSFEIAQEMFYAMSVVRELTSA